MKNITLPIYQGVLVGLCKEWRRLTMGEAKQKESMKRYGNLFERIISIENLMKADEKARKGKKNRYGIKIHDKRREENIRRLHESLKSHTYRTSAYDVFKIYEPKERDIYRLPYYPDRILHHAIMNVMEEIWVKTFTYNTYSCVKGRGIKGCFDRVKAILSGHKNVPLYCLKIDIRKFYPSIDHDVLKRIVRRKIKDRELLWLLDEVIDSCDGLPIGNYLSQYFANLTMCYLMHTVIAEWRQVESTEYADDFCFFSENKEMLHSLLHTLIIPYIRDRLHLELKGNYQIFRIAENRYDSKGRGVDYVGYVFYRDHTEIRKSIKKRYAQKAIKILSKRGLSARQKKMRLSSWAGWCKHADARHLNKKLLKQYYYEITVKH